MITNHHIAAMLASERQRDLVDGARRWRRAERPLPSAVPSPPDSLSTSMSASADAEARGARIDGRLRIVRARYLAASRERGARTHARC